MGSISSTPEDTEFKETIKNARKKLETSVAPAKPCKIAKNCGSGASNKIQTKLACILETNESTRMRMGNSIPPNHEDHIARKGENSLQHYNLVLYGSSQLCSYSNHSQDTGCTIMDDIVTKADDLFPTQTQIEIPTLQP